MTCNRIAPRKQVSGLAAMASLVGTNKNVVDRAHHYCCRHSKLIQTRELPGKRETMRKSQQSNNSNNGGLVARTAIMKRLCCTFNAELDGRHNNNIKEEYGGERSSRSSVIMQQPRVLTRLEVKSFFYEHIIRSNDTQSKGQRHLSDIVDVMARGDVLLVAQSNIFRQLDDPLDFQLLSPEHKTFLDQYILGSFWQAILTYQNCLCAGENYLIMIKQIDSPSLKGLSEILLRGGCKFAIKELRGGKSKFGGIEALVNENHGRRFGMFTPPDAEMRIKEEQEEDRAG